MTQWWEVNFLRLNSKIYSVVLLSLLIGLYGCSSKEVVKFSELKPLDSALPVSRVWTRTMLNEERRTDPMLPVAVDDQYYYWVDRFDRLQVQDKLNGKSVWSYTADSPISSAAGLGHEAVAVGTRNATVVYFKKENQNLIWKQQLSSEILAAPIITDSMMIVHCVDGKLFALDLADGHELWRYESKVPLLSLRGIASPVLADETIILGLSNGKVVALNVWDGQLLWQVEVATPSGRTELERMVDVDARPVVKDGIVYAVSYQGRLVALQLRTGRLLWAQDMSSSLGMIVDDNNVYVTDNDGVIWAINRLTGQTDWKQVDLLHRELTAPVAYQQYLLVGDVTGYVHWLDRSTGLIIHRMRHDHAEIDTSPIVSEGVLFLNTRGGVLDAVTLLAP